VDHGGPGAACDGARQAPPPTRVAVPRPPTPKSRPAGKVIKPEADPDLARIRALDKQWGAEYKKPWTQRDFQSLLAKYQAVRLTPGSYLATRLQAQIKHLHVEIRRVADVRAVAKLARDNAARRDEYLKRAAKAEVAALSPGAPPVPYSAQGIVTTSGVFRGSKAVAGRFVLRDPKLFRVRAYLLSSRRTVNLAQYAGQLVGVYGKVRHDPTTQRRLIDVQKVAVLQPKVNLPSLPKPTVKIVKIPKPTTQPAKAKQGTSRPAGAKPDKAKAAPAKGRKRREKKA